MGRKRGKKSWGFNLGNGQGNGFGVSKRWPKPRPETPEERAAREAREHLHQVRMSWELYNAAHKHLDQILPLHEGTVCKECEKILEIPAKYLKEESLDEWAARMDDKGLDQRVLDEAMDTTGCVVGPEPCAVPQGKSWRQQDRPNPYGDYSQQPAKDSKFPPGTVKSYPKWEPKRWGG